MNNYYDINIGEISVVVKKNETSEFVFKCENRHKDGFVFVTGGKGIFEGRKEKIGLQKGEQIGLQKGRAEGIAEERAKLETNLRALGLSEDMIKKALNKD